ncbi:MAG: LPS-assembly protein LptD, partial [Candidatus Krumholzibacteriota bacterium]|nr:LPS-assembly protein LptD [Candidatus Krumholzibacteriota bacterium]
HTITPSATYSYTPAIQGRESSWRVSVNLRNAIDLKVAEKPKRPVAEEGSSDEASSMAPPPDLGDPRQAASLPKSSEAPGDSSGDGGAAQTGEEEKTRKLSGVFFWTLGASYALDQSRDEHRWSRISSLVNLRVLGTNISLNQSIDPYGFEVMNTSLTSSVSLRGTHPFGRSEKKEERELNVAAMADSLEASAAAKTPPAAEEGQEARETEETEEERGLPWDLSLSFSYSNSKGAPDPNSTLNIGGGFTLTKGWKLTYRSSYNVISREFLGDYFGVTRDLHCWEMSFGRQKLADEWEFYFKIFIKSHPEIYAEQGSRGLGGGSFSSPISGY